MDRLELELILIDYKKGYELLSPPEDAENAGVCPFSEMNSSRQIARG
jgi:hypothetical protein